MKNNEMSSLYVTIDSKEAEEINGGISWEVAALVVAVYYGVYQLGEGVGRAAYHATH